MPISPAGAPTRRGVLGTSVCSDGKSTSSSTFGMCGTRWSCTPSTASPYYLGDFVGAPTRRFSAICTIYLATPTRSTSASMTTASQPRRGNQSDTVREVLPKTTCNIPPTSSLPGCARTSSARCAPGKSRSKNRGKLLRFYGIRLEGYTYLEEPQHT